MAFFRRNHQADRAELARQIRVELRCEEIGPPKARWVPIKAVEDILKEDRLHELFRKLKWYNTESVSYICKHAKIIVAILIRADWSDWERLPDILGPKDHRTTLHSCKIADSLLPLKEDELSDLERRCYNTGIRAFSLYQHDLAPVKIRENTYDKFPKNARLPYVEEPEPIGEGAYGNVFKVRIAKGYLTSGPGYNDINDETREMAVKIYKSERRQRGSFGTEFEKERKIFNKFREALIQTNRVAKNFAAFVHDDQLMIMSPLASMDLATFLSGEYAEFENYARHPNTFSPLNIINEAWALFGALKYLHGGLDLGIGRKQVIVHLDLKPDNILIYDLLGGSTPSVGVWKIADFNLAESDNHLNNESPMTPAYHTRFTPGRLTPGDLIREKSIRSGHGGAREGRYLPPELRTSKAVVADKKTDVWSFGCIMADILAFVTGGPIGVETMHEKLISNTDDYFYDLSRGREAIAKQSFTDWLNSTAGQPKDDGWIINWRSLIHSMLEIDRNRRCDLGDRSGPTTAAEMKSAERYFEDIYQSMTENDAGKRRMFQLSQYRIEPSPQVGLSPLQSTVSPDSELPSPGQQIMGALLNTTETTWTFLKLDFPGTANHTYICPKGRSAVLMKNNLAVLYDLSFRGRELWFTAESDTRHGSGLVGQCAWQATDGYVWLKARIAGSYIALLQVDRRGQAGKIILQAWQNSEPPMAHPPMELTLEQAPDDLSISESGTMLLQFHGRIELRRPGGNISIRLQNVISSSFSLCGQSFVAWERISDKYYWHIWDLKGEALRTLEWRYNTQPNTRSDSEQRLIPLGYGHRWVACDIHGQLLLIDHTKDKPVTPTKIFRNLMGGHSMLNDRGLLVIKEAKPQSVSALTVESGNHWPVRDIDQVPKSLEIKPDKCSTTVAVLDITATTPYLFVLYRNTLIARRSVG